MSVSVPADGTGRFSHACGAREDVRRRGKNSIRRKCVKRVLQATARKLLVRCKIGVGDFCSLGKPLFLPLSLGDLARGGEFRDTQFRSRNGLRRARLLRNARCIIDLKSRREERDPSRRLSSLPMTRKRVTKIPEHATFVERRYREHESRETPRVAASIPRPGNRSCTRARFRRARTQRCCGRLLSMRDSAAATRALTAFTSRRVRRRADAGFRSRTLLLSHDVPP